MTTSTDETMKTEEPRGIDELIELPYSQMNDEEIEAVIQFKATQAAQDAKYQIEIDMIQANLEDIAQIHRNMAQEASETLNMLTAHALRRLEEESK